MFTLRVFILLVYLNACTDSHVIEVVGSGMSKLHKNDMVVVFYVTVKHYGKKPRRAMATVVDCCEKVAEGDNDCDLIDLFGGDFGVIQPGTVTNLTFIYPSLYGYNRKGYCTVKVIHRDLGQKDVAELHHQIEFDTRLTTDGVPQTLTGFYEPESLLPCETPDLDPLDHCHPVDCQLKYAGYRNFYNRRAKMCQRVPSCIADPEKELPDVVYVPTSNTCWDMEKSVGKEDIERLTKWEAAPKSDQMVNIRCHHGEIDPRTGLCVCDYGWKSEPFSPELLQSSKSFYSMCTIKCRAEDPYKSVPFWAGLVLGIWLLFFVSLCEWNNVFAVRKKGDVRNGDGKYYGGSKDVCDSPHTIELSSSDNAVVGSRCKLQPT